MAKTIKKCGTDHNICTAPSTHDTGILLHLPETTIDTLLDLRENGGELGDVLCAGLDEIMRFLIDDSIDDLSDKPHLQRLQTLMMIRDLIQRLTVKS